MEERNRQTLLLPELKVKQLRWGQCTLLAMLHLADGMRRLAHVSARENGMAIIARTSIVPTTTKLLALQIAVVMACA
jgi:hypothetical protein